MNMINEVEAMTVKLKRNRPCAQLSMMISSFSEELCIAQRVLTYLAYYVCSQ
jgi:hypothetical protein